jgi:heptosyltransferase-1
MRKIRYYKKILIIKPSSLGDVVHSLPFLNVLKTCFPRTEIHWLIAQGLEGLFEGHPMVEKYITINKDTWKKISRTGDTIKEVRQLYKRLKDEKYDVAVDLQGLFRSGLITMATRAPIRAGFTEAREGSSLFYNRKIKGGKNIHAVDRYLKIADALGCDTERVLFPFPLMKDHMKEIKDLKSYLKDYIVIVPGARWETKKWPAEKFGRLAGMLSLKSFVVGGETDVAIAEKVVAHSRGNALSLAGGTNLRELIEIMRGARFIISNDSGPMHIGAGLNVPVVALFGPTSPLRTGPYGKGHIIIKNDLECSPCFKKRCRNVKCMGGISVDMVYERICGVFHNANKGT